MPLSVSEHLESIYKHLDLVRANCLLVGKKLIVAGEVPLGRQIIVRGFQHDLSKISDDAEWDSLHTGKDVPEEKLIKGIEHHRSVNDHHVEFWGDILRMPQACIAEMCCDILARCQQFGEDFRSWMEENIIKKNNLMPETDQHKWICKYVEMLLENEFVKVTAKPKSKSKAIA